MARHLDLSSLSFEDLCSDSNSQVVESSCGDIAIIGIGVRLPQADTLEEVWDNILEGVQSFREMPLQRKQDLQNYWEYTEDIRARKHFSKCAYLDNIDCFDANFFKITPMEAKLMSPGQRLFLECAWEAVENAGYAGGQMDDSVTGVYLGLIGDLDAYEYKEMIHRTNPKLLPASVTGNLGSMTVGRLSYHLNLKGPAMLIDTACSSSLVAVDTACQALRTGKCDMILVGGARINLSPVDDECYKIGIESSDSCTRTFDETADGSGFGEGVVVMLLKPLNKAQRDGDYIHGVIKGSATNQDGHSSALTAPNTLSQERVLLEAWERAGISPEDLTYFEAHGTGTKIGDIIELEAIQNAFSHYTQKKQFCAIGSYKTAIGHLYECAGIAGLLRTVLALKHKVIPSTLAFNLPNTKVDFSQLPVYINERNRPWENNGKSRLAAVSAFGISGTNCHIVVEESESPIIRNSIKRLQLFKITAKNYKALENTLVKMLKYLTTQKNLDFSNLCYSANIGRGDFEYRLIIVAECQEDLEKTLRSFIRGQFEDNCFYGVHQVVSENRKPQKDIEISLAQKASYTKAILSQIEILRTKEAESKEQLAIIAKNYVNGGDMPWNSLYSLGTYSRVPLPTYGFDKQRYWVEMPKIVSKEAHFFYGTEWIPTEPLEAIDSLDNGKAVLILRTPDGYGEILKDYFKNTKRIVLEEDIEQNISSESIEKLVDKIIHHNVGTIIHLGAFVTEGGSLRNPSKTVKEGLFVLYYLSQVLQSKCINKDVNVVILTQNAREVNGCEPWLCPEASPTIGFGKVLNQECNDICRVIDIDQQTLIEQVVKEIQTKSPYFHVALRKNHRYVEQFGKKHLQTIETQKVEYKQEGVYVITGGMGHIGQTFAEHIGTKIKGTIVLLCRTHYPEKDQWTDIIKADGDSPLSKKLQRIIEIENKGCSVEIYRVDICDQKNTEKVFQYIRDRHGEINGIIHSAGLPGRGFIINKTVQDIETVLAPKVRGAWILHQTTKRDNLDFFVLCSSGVSIIGEIGQSDYTAANTYLDALAEYRNQLGKKTIAINWVVWENARMQEGQSVIIDGVFKKINSQEAMQAFEEVLNKNISNVLIGQINDQSPLISSLLSQLSFEVSDEILNVVSKGYQQKESSRKYQSTTDLESVTLVGGRENNYSNVELRLAKIFRRTLGFEEINVHDSFFDMGGNSILLNRMLAEIQEQYPGKVTVADIFTHSSISKLAQFIGNTEGSNINSHQSTTKKYDEVEPIAIIGMACQLPLAENVEEFWQNTLHGVDCVRKIPFQRQKDLDPYWAYIEKGQSLKYMEAGYLERIDEFDYGFFNISPKEAALTDPAQRLFLQVAWHALEDAGYGGETLYGSNTGVYLGFANIIRDSYQKMIHDINPRLISRSIVGNVSAMIPSRISYLLNLNGPSMVVDTACSSSLVTTHMACNAIRSGECDMAIAGGVKLFLAPFDDENMKIGIESSDGRTRAFSEQSDGAGMGEGVGVVVLKPLSKAMEDKDRIHGVIKGSAINQDGASMGITAPNPDAQTKVIIKAWEQGGIHPKNLVHIETHGTGTALGDPIEIHAVNNALKSYKINYNQVAISAVKSSIGHLNECAGVVGLIKTLKIIKEKVLPPTIYFNNPNKKIEFPYSPVYLNTKPRKWENTRRPMQCAISSFGFSGTNCHMVVEETPQNNKAETKVELPILMLSAKSFKALLMLINNYIDFINAHTTDELGAISYTQNCGRGHYRYRVAIIFENQQDLLNKLHDIQDGIEEGSIPLGVWWGQHKVVAKITNSLEEYELTIEKKWELEQQLVQVIERIDPKQGAENYEYLSKIAEIYVKGATINWDLFYNHTKYPKCDVPLYPFEKNRCWIELEEKKLLSNFTENNLYQISWTSINTLLEVTKKEKRILVLVNQNSYALQLKNKLLEININCIVLEIECNEQTLKVSEIVESNNIDRVIDLSYITMGEEALEPEEIGFVASQNLHKYSERLINLNTMSSNEKLEYILVLDHTYSVEGTESILKPQNAPLFGFSRGADKESKQIQHFTVDIDEFTKVETVAEWLMAETIPYLVALRNEMSYQESFDALKEVPEEEYLELSSEGIYIITGGTGGIGSEIALHLASMGAINIAVLGRSKLPDPDQWTTTLETCEDQKICTKLERLKKIKKQCNTLEYYVVDFHDSKSLEKILEELRIKYKQINGIIHGSGVPGNGFLEEITSDKLHNVILPKIQGTCLLDALTREDDLQFFIMFSSVATVIESVGQADYIGANGFLDAYAGYLKQVGRKVITINWTTWKEIGMAKDFGFVMDTSFKTIGIRDALRGFEQALMLPVTRVLIGKINYDNKMANQIRQKGFILPQEISDALDKQNKTSKKEDLNKKSCNNKQVKLSGRSTGKYSLTERILGEICNDLLGFEQLDIYEHFFELGADSILIKQMYMQIQDRFSIQINIADLFEYSNIDKLGKYIEQIIENERDKRVPIKSDSSKELESMVESVQRGDLDIEELVNTIINT